MQTTLKWNSGIEFIAEIGQHQITLDGKAPLGKDKGPTPKELVVAGLAGCTAMDVIALLKKYKQPVTALSVTSSVKTSEPTKHPVVFTEALIEFHATGEIDPAKLIEAVELSQTKFCGVSAMFAELFPVRWEIQLNGNSIKSGQANFKA
jgi:putative redox protein